MEVLKQLKVGQEMGSSDKPNWSTKNNGGPKTGQIGRQKIMGVLRQIKLVDKKKKEN